MGASDQQPAVDSLSASGRAGRTRPSPAGRACPLCGSNRVYRSHRRGLTERVIALAGFKIRRCHACNVRFIRFGRSFVLLADVRRATSWCARWALGLAGAVLVLAAILWLSVRQAAG